MTLGVESHPNQSTAETLSSPAQRSGEAIKTLLREARRSQERWAAIGVSARLQALGRLKTRLVDEALSLAATVRVPTRAHLAETITAEILPLADATSFLLTHADELLSPRRIRSGRPLWLSGTQLEVRREPVGVVLVIGASNYPIFLPGVQMVQALAAGNAVIVKPGRGGHPCAAMLREWLIDSGVPAGVVSVLSESPADAQAALSLGVDKVLLTGSTQTGTSVLAQAASTLTPVVAELSGCDAAFVCPDADLSRVADLLAFSLRFNGSATCIAPRRVFVPTSQSAELETAMRDRVDRIAPIEVDEALFRQMSILVESAIEHGATMLTPRPSEASRFTPLLLTNAAADSALLKSDLFLPILSFVPVRDMEHALELSRRCPYALGASIFSRNLNSARALAAKVDAGCVVINDLIAPTADPRLPFGGRHASGFGVTRGAEGLLELTNIKAVVVRRGRRLPHIDMAEQITPRAAHLMLQSLHGKTLVDRLRAGWRLVAAMAQSRPIPPSI